jgi:glycine betaine/proline transport system substrate-binding protein
MRRTRTATSRVLRAVFTLLVVGAVASCGGLLQDADGDGVEKPAVTIAYQEWARAVAISHVAEVILEDNGFDVTLETMSNADVWAAVADGSADAMLAAWLPNTHGDFYGDNGQYTDQVYDAGANYQGARLGLIVPSYVSVSSIADLNASAATFSSQIQGIDPGAGIMATTQTMIDNDTYSLGGWTLLEGSGSTMTNALGSAIDNQEAIVVTGWAPHWMFGKWDLKFLDDPQDVYGTPEDIHTILRLGLDADNEGVYQFFNEFSWPQVNVQEAMVAIREGTTPQQAARDFVDANQATIDEHLPDTEYFQ